MPTAKPAVVDLNAGHRFAQHLLLMVPFCEGSGQPGVIRGADGVTAGAPTSTTWTGTPATWSANSGGTCVHNDGSAAMPLRLGAIGSGAWVPTGDCTIAWIYGASTNVALACSNSVPWLQTTVSGGSTLAVTFACASGGQIFWDYGGTANGASRVHSSSTATHHLDPPDTWVVTVGAAGMKIYRNGAAFASQSARVTRTSDTTALTIMQMPVLQDVNFFQISAMEWDAATVAAWSADPYAHLVPYLRPGVKALMYALGNVARGGATRGAYHDARVYVAIGGVQYATARPDPTTKIVDGSLTVNDVIDDTPNTCDFQTQGFIPTEGQDVVITLGSMNSLARVFGGTILSVQRGYVGTPANLRASVHAIDPTWSLNRRKALAHYRNQSVSTIAADLIASFASGVTTRGVQRGLPTLDEISFTNQNLTDALTQLVKRISGFWHIDYLSNLHLFVGSEPLLTNPTDLTPAHVSMRDVQSTRDLSQMVTRVYHEGGGVNALTEVAAGETALPVESVAWYDQAGGIVTTGTQRLSYTGLTAGGAGALVGPGAAPTVAPTATPAVGTGLGAGTYHYAYTDVTAAGESLPSPLGPAVTGALTDPLGGPAIRADTTTWTTQPGFAVGDTIQVGIQYSSDFYGFQALSAFVAGYSMAVPVGFGGGTHPAVLHAYLTGVARPALARYAFIYASKNGGTYQQYATVNLGTGSTYTLDVPLFSVNGYSPPPSANRTLQQVALSGIATGVAAVTARKVYRTVLNGTQLKLLATLSDNTTTTYTDTTADGSLGADVPTGDTSGLTQPAGQALAGATTLLLSSAGPFPSAGWALVGSEAVRYSGVSGNSLTGIPASGAGSLLMTVLYGTPVLVAPQLTGIPASGAGALVSGIKKGDPINVLAQVDDLDAQAALAAFVGGDGVQEVYLSDNRLSLTEALARATAYLTQVNQVLVTLSFKTRDPNTISGRTITVDLPAPTGLSGTFTIQAVTITEFTPNVLPTYDVRAASTVFSADDLLRLATQPSRNGAA